jgi:hypothetical protein
MAADDYDDDAAVRFFLDRFWSHYLTDLEMKCYDAAMRNEKANAKPESRWAQMVRAEIGIETNEDIRSAVAEGFHKLQQRLREKVLIAFMSGALKVNRCPRCHTVARTPKARQCFRCGNDWH